MTQTHTATEITNGFYIRNNTIETIEEGSWMVLTSEGNAFCKEGYPGLAWVAKDKDNAESLAGLIPRCYPTVFEFTKIYTSTEEAQAAL